MKTNLKIAEEKDISLIAQIYKIEFSKPPYNENWTTKKAEDKMIFFKKFYDLYTINFEDKIIGFIVVNSNFMCPGEVAFGEEFAIKKEFQNKGIGTEVIKEMFKIYKKRGFKRFMGIADVESKAYDLYTKIGFLPSKKDVLIEKKLK